MHRKHYFRSWEEADRNNAGGYTYPILDSFGEYSISTFTLPENEADLEWITGYIQQDKTLLSYVDGHTIVVVRAGFSMSDMGLAVFTTDSGTGKTVKRLKTVARPFRSYVHLDRPLVIQIVDGGLELDGGFIINPDLLREADNNVDIPGWHPVQRAGLIRALDHMPVRNARGLGDMVDTDGNVIHYTLKGNGFRGKAEVFDPGVDIITTADNLKEEVYMEGNGSWFMTEPQGPKPAYEDQQTVVNMPFMLSVPEARKRMKESTTEFISHLTSGGVLSSVEDLSKSEFSKDFAYDSDTFARLLRWHANKWALHGMSYRVSPWLTEQLGKSHMATYGISDHRSLRIPIPGAIRAQVVTESLVQLAGYNVEVPPGEITWLKQLGVAVVNDSHWVHQLIDTHGGCDLDDFFVIRRDGDKAVITRNPNARGEYTEFDHVIKWWKGSEEARPFTRKSRPTPILDAIGAGETSYAKLPSEVNPPAPSVVRMYNTGDTIRDIESMMTVEGSYGQYSLALMALNSTHLTRHPAEQVASEDGVDSFTQGGSADDQRFVTDMADTLLTRLVAQNKPVDPLILKRLPKEIQELVTVDPDGPIATFKRVMMKAEEDFTKKLREFTQSIEVPHFLEVIGKNNLRNQAVSVLRESRRAMWQADKRDLDIREAQERGITIHHPTDKERVIFHFEGVLNLIEGIEDDHNRHLFVMALWHACLTTPTSRGKVTDQLVFGTKVLDHLLAALVYFGIAEAPYLTDEGHVARTNNVKFQEGYSTWSMTCTVCETTYDGGHIEGVRGFHDHDGVCKNCRD